MAGTSDRVQFEIKPRVVSQIVSRAKGETKILVASNAAFNVSAAGMIGDVTVTIEEAGHIDGTSFGASAQLPGDRTQTTFVTTAFETPIYQAEEKTAQHSGTPLEQAVLIRISYSGLVHPEIKVQPSI